MALDGLTDAYDRVSMGESTDRHNARLDISRADQDAFGAASHQRAAAAQKEGGFAEDDHIRRETTVETLAKLKPAFTADGTITAATSSPISDGACAVVVMRKAKAEELGLPWLPRNRGPRHGAGP